MHIVEMIIGWMIEALVFIVRELLAFAVSVPDTVAGWGAPEGVTFLVASIVVVFACLVLWHSAPSLLASVGLWLAWRYVLAAQAATAWIIARIEARRRRKGTHSEWTSGWRTGEAYAPRRDDRRRDAGRADWRTGACTRTPSGPGTAREQGVGDAEQRSKRQDEEQGSLSTACPALPPRPGEA